MSKLKRKNKVVVREFLHDKITVEAKLLCFILEIEGLNIREALKFDLMEENTFLNASYELIENGYLSIHIIKRNERSLYKSLLINFSGENISNSQVKEFSKDLEQIGFKETDRIEKINVEQYKTKGIEKELQKKLKMILMEKI